MEEFYIFDTVELTNDIEENYKGILVDFYERKPFSHPRAFLLMHKKNKSTFHVKSKSGYYICSFGTIRDLMSIKISRMVLIEKTMVDKTYLKDLFEARHPLKHVMNRLFNFQGSLEDTSSELL